MSVSLLYQVIVAELLDSHPHRYRACSINGTLSPLGRLPALPRKYLSHLSYDSRALLP